MNKMIKGSIAGATGVALLMGGFGTYALWSDSDNLDATTVNSGQLNIIANNDGVWDDVNTIGVPGDWSASDLLVPGDVVSYTQTFTVNGDGKNLEGTISLDLEDMSPNEFTTLIRTVDVVDSGAGSTDISKDSATEFSFTDPFGTATLTATVTYELPVGTGGTTDQNASATTPASTFTIAQN